MNKIEIEKIVRENGIERVIFGNEDDLSRKEIDYLIVERIRKEENKEVDFGILLRIFLEDMWELLEERLEEMSFDGILKFRNEEGKVYYRLSEEMD